MIDLRSLLDETKAIPKYADNSLAAIISMAEDSVAKAIKAEPNRKRYIYEYNVKQHKLKELMLALVYYTQWYPTQLNIKSVNEVDHTAQNPSHYESARIVFWIERDE